MFGGFVMATGIVSIAIRMDGYLGLSRALLVLTVAGWSCGAVLLVGRCLDRRLLAHHLRRLSALTAAAATAVLGTRLTLLGWTWAGWTLLGVAAIICSILWASLRRAGATSRSGAAFLLVVAPQSLAVLAALLAAHLVLAWLAVAALLVFVLGLLGYAWVLARFDFAELRRGAGDHWVAGGALAISALACAELARATGALRATVGLQDALRDASVVLWLLTMAWLPVLVAGEALWVRRRFDVRRWATVFPLGMYSVMSFAVGTVARSAWMVGFGRAWAWIAGAAWLATAAGAARAAPRLLGAAQRYRATIPLARRKER